MEKVLIIEDDSALLNLLELELSHEGFSVCSAKDGRTGLAQFETENPSFVLLDIMLPVINGIEVLRRLRIKSQVPVILITARGETLDKVNGLNAGADDYITKPFKIEELVARIQAVLRRTRPPAGDTAPLINKDITLIPEQMKVFIKEQPVDFSKIEFLILKLLLKHTGRVFSRSEIITHVWGGNYFIEDNCVDVYIGHLRTKIGSLTDDAYIKTVRGAGYVMQEL